MGLSATKVAVLRRFYLNHDDLHQIAAEMNVEASEVAEIVQAHGPRPVQEQPLPLSLVKQRNARGESVVFGRVVVLKEPWFTPTYMDTD